MYDVPQSRATGVPFSQMSCIAKTSVFVSTSINIHLAFLSLDVLLAIIEL